jgi:hypothetical protein
VFDGNSDFAVVLAACCLCLVLAGGLALAVLGFVRRRGTLLLPFLQVLFGREETRDDAVVPRPAAKPDLRAIAREHDFDEALARQQQAPSTPTAAPPGWELPPDPLNRPRPSDDTQRIRDEDEEIGFDALDD